MNLPPDDVSQAVVLWTGRGRDSWPTRRDERVIEHFGEVRGSELLAAVHRLDREFFESDAYRTVADLVEMGDRAASRFRARHPELSPDAVAALRWCYVYSYK